jgi:putative flippase GtrA
VSLETDESLATPGLTSHRLSTPLDRYILSVARRVGGAKAREVERFMKFIVVGSIGFVVDFGTVILLQATILPPVTPDGNALPGNVVLATSIAFVLAILSNYTWNRLWTYPDSRSSSIRRQLFQFALVSTIGWLARTAWINLTYQPLGAILYPIFGGLAIFQGISSEDAAARLGTMLAQLIGVFVVMIWNFFVNRYWTFSDVE